MDQVHHNARLHNSCLGQEGDDGPGHTFKERAGHSSASLYPQSLAEHLPAGIPQMFSEQNSIVLMAQGSRASGKVPGSQQWAELSTLHTSPTVTAGITVTLAPTLCAEPHALDTMAIPHQGPACFCDLTSCMAPGGALGTSSAIFFFLHCSEFPIYF